jgi:hypothetical protein
MSAQPALRGLVQLIEAENIPTEFIVCDLSSSGRLIRAS